MNIKRHKEVRFLIEKTNHVLNSNGCKPMDDDDDFVEGEFSREDYAVYSITRDDCIELRLEFDIAGVDVGINEFHEVHSLSYDEIKEDSQRYEEYLNELFFDSVIVRKCYFGLVFYYVKKSSGEINLIRKVRFGCLTLLFPFLPLLPIGCDSIEFKPLFQKF